MHLVCGGYLDACSCCFPCRLNFRLARACDDDITALCSNVCNPFQGEVCGGRVLQCLTQKQDQIQSKECGAEVFYFEKMEVNDFRNDAPLAEACRSDVDKFCHKVEPGKGVRTCEAYVYNV